MIESGTPLELLGWSRQGITYPQLTDTQGISRVVVEHRGAYEILGPFGAHEAILETASDKWQMTQPTIQPSEIG